MKFNIIPNSSCASEIEANSAEEAIEQFALEMDMDMNAYFKAVPADEADSK